MKYNPDIHHRRSIRLREYDYSRAGAYFITVCAQDRACLFGDLVDGEMWLNDAGRMVQKWWGELNQKYPTIETDEFVVMPNHFHGVIMIVGADLRVCPNQGTHTGAPLHGSPLPGAPLSRIIQWFKTMTTNEYIRHVKTDGRTAFPGRLWQRNYYEHIIRNDESLNLIREYIMSNPSQWGFDRENPAGAYIKPNPAKMNNGAYNQIHH